MCRAEFEFESHVELDEILPLFLNLLTPLTVSSAPGTLLGRRMRQAPAAWGFARRGGPLTEAPAPGAAPDHAWGQGALPLGDERQNPNESLLVFNRDPFKVTKLPSPGASPAFRHDSPRDSPVSAALAFAP